MTRAAALAICAAVYFLVGAKVIPLKQTGLGIAQRILRGAVLFTMVLAAGRAISVSGIARIEDAATRFTLQRITHLVLGLVIAVIVISIVFVNWYAAVAALGVGSIIMGLAVPNPDEELYRVDLHSGSPTFSRRRSHQNRRRHRRCD